MTISLKIDNFDALPDGGPLGYRASGRGFEIGREHRDWTLPDPNMFISGRHCEVRFEKGGYWLYDVSRNGTFLNGSTQRVKSPYLLANGDRLQDRAVSDRRVGRVLPARRTTAMRRLSLPRRKVPTISGTPAGRRRRRSAGAT